MSIVIPDRNIFVKVHNDARSTAAGCYGKVTHITEDRYLVAYVKDGTIMTPIWIDKKYCAEIPPTTEIEIEETT